MSCCHNCPQVNNVGPHRGRVNISPGLVPSGNEPLLEPALTIFYNGLWLTRGQWFAIDFAIQFSSTFHYLNSRLIISDVLFCAMHVVLTLCVYSHIIGRACGGPCRFTEAIWRTTGSSGPSWTSTERRNESLWSSRSRVQHVKQFCIWEYWFKHQIYLV